MTDDLPQPDAGRRVPRTDTAADGAEGPDGVARSRSWRQARRDARALAEDPEQAATLLERASDKLRTNAASQRLAGVMDDLEAALRMAKLRLRGEYGAPGAERLVLLFAALLYLVNPMDLVPDAIPAAGLLDDAAIVGWMLGKLREELDRFRAWETSEQADSSTAETGQDDQFLAD